MFLEESFPKILPFCIILGNNPVSLGGDFLKFIFPQNYDFKNKILGIIDYSTAFVNLFWYGLVFIFINLFFHSLTLKIFVFVVCCFPLFLLSFAGFNGENIVYVFSYLFRFLLKPKLFLYKKNEIS